MHTQQVTGTTGKLKILFLSHRFYPAIGGIESISDMLATEFSKAGHEVKLLTWSTDDTNKSFGFEVIRKPGLGQLFQGHAWADIVFENNPCLRMAWMSVFFKRKTIIALQTWINRPNTGAISWQDVSKMFFIKRALGIVACSNALKQKYSPSSFVIGNPYKEQDFKQLPGIKKSVDFVFLGRLVSDKGVDLIIKALHQLVTINAHLTLRIIGDGPEKQNLQNMAVELGLEKNITFTGAMRGVQLVEALNQCRFIVVPSRWQEPFGIVVLEGMACGCIPIVSNGGGLPDAVGNAGVVFERDNVASLVLAISSVLLDPLEEERLKQAAPAHLESFRSVEVSKKYLAVFRQSLHNN